MVSVSTGESSEERSALSPALAQAKAQTGTKSRTAKASSSAGQRSKLKLILMNFRQNSHYGRYHRNFVFRHTARFYRIAKRRSERFESRSIKPNQSVGATAQTQETVIGLCQTRDVWGSSIFEGPGLVTYLQVR